MDRRAKEPPRQSPQRFDPLPERQRQPGQRPPDPPLVLAGVDHAPARGVADGPHMVHDPVERRSPHDPRREFNVRHDPHGPPA